MLISSFQIDLPGILLELVVLVIRKMVTFLLRKLDEAHSGRKTIFRCLGLCSNGATVVDVDQGLLITLLGRGGLDWKTRCRNGFV